MLDINSIRNTFPILSTQVNNKPLIYLDNAATTQKPQPVLDAITGYYSYTNSNIHRGVHTLSQLATTQYEKVRKIIQQFINAKSETEICFVRGATEGINLVATCYGETFFKPNDEIIISQLEHHANIVPWQQVCKKTGAKLRIIPVNNAGELDFVAFTKLLSNKTCFVSLTFVSNALGTVVPIEQYIAAVRQHQSAGYTIPVLIDAAQAIQHLSLDVSALDADFLVASGHKMYAPTGIGFLYAKKKWLETMPPYQTGGDMILSVDFDKTIFNEVPYKFEAGTPNICGTIALGKAIEYINSLGMQNIYNYEADLLNYATNAVSTIPGLKIIGTAAHKASVISFVFDDIHPHDIGTFLDVEGVAVRTGHHCAEPLIKRFGVPATTRLSLAFYNTKAEIDTLTECLHKIVKMFR